MDAVCHVAGVGDEVEDQGAVGRVVAVDTPAADPYWEQIEHRLPSLN